MENRPVIPNRPQFIDLMRPSERLAELIYLPIHLFALPLLLPKLALIIPNLDSVTLNLIYYIIGFAYTLILCWRFLHAGFSAAIDRIGSFLIAIASSYLLETALSLILSYALILLNAVDLSSPNNAAIEAMAPEGLNKLMAMTVFMAPIVEEVLFRGLVFGGLHRRSRLLAWIVSALVFSLYHVWQYAIRSPAALFSAVLYLPASLAFNWCYERSGSIWAPILYHMLANAIGMSMMY